MLVPVLDEIEHISETVAGMQDQALNGRIEVLLIDGGSTDGTREVLDALGRRDARFEVLDNPQRSIPAALNIGLRRARGLYVARMDAHTHYPPDYLRRGIERLRRGGVDWVSGPALPAGEGTWSRRVTLALHTRLGVGGASFRRRSETEFDCDTGFCGVWRRETLLAHGGWDERSLVNEDAELAARVREGGGRIVCVPQLAARYVPRNSLSGLARQYWRYGQYRARTSRLHPESMRRSNLLPPALAAAVTAGAIGPRWLRPASRVPLAAYVAAVGATSAGQARHRTRADAAWLPVVFVTMHLAWGFGFIAGAVRFGPPVAAVGRALRGGSARSGVAADESRGHP